MRKLILASLVLVASFSGRAFAADGNPIRLGDGALTGGIPGSGALKLAEVET